MTQVWHVIVLSSMLVVGEVCLVVGFVQGCRYIRTEPLLKSAPWLMAAVLTGAMISVLAQAWGAK